MIDSAQLEALKRLQSLYHAAYVLRDMGEEKYRLAEGARLRSSRRASIILQAREAYARAEAIWPAGKPKPSFRSVLCA